MKITPFLTSSDGVTVSSSSFRSRLGSASVSSLFVSKVFKIADSCTVEVFTVSFVSTSVSSCGMSLTNTCSCSSFSFEALDSVSFISIVGVSRTVRLSCTCTEKRCSNVKLSCLNQIWWCLAFWRNQDKTSSSLWMMTSSSLSLSPVTSRVTCSASSEFLIASTVSSFSFRSWTVVSSLLTISGSFTTVFTVSVSSCSAGVSLAMFSPFLEISSTETVSLCSASVPFTEVSTVSESFSSSTSSVFVGICSMACDRVLVS